MADSDKHSDLEKLLAETEAALGTGSSVATPRRSQAPGRPAGVLVERVRFAALAGAVGAGAMWLLFSVLPFLGSISGAAGAFLATFVAVLVVRRR